MNYIVIDRETYYRKGVYRHFSEDCRCSVSMTARIDVTALQEYSRRTGTKFYINFLYLLSKVLNSREDYRMVMTKANYGSLLDHLGSGRDWDLARKNGGLCLLPPYSQNGGMYKGRLDALANIWSYVEHSKAQYVVLANCDVVTTIDLNPALIQHKKSDADITLIYGRGYYDDEKNKNTAILQLDEENIVNDVLLNPRMKGEFNQWLEMLIISKDLLKQIVFESVSKSTFSFTREVLQNKECGYKIMGYEHKEMFMRIDSKESYFAANKRLLDSDARKALFKPKMPVYTKVGDNAPVKYGLESNIKNSLIADGCIIEGTVENSILFRGVKVGKGTVIKDSVIMQGAVIGNNCKLSEIITDKNVEIRSDKILNGSETYPVYIKKNGRI